MIRQILDEYDKKELQDQIDELKTNGGGSSSNETTGTGGSVWFSGTDVRFDGVYQLSAVPGATLLTFGCVWYDRRSNHRSCGRKKEIA